MRLLSIFFFCVICLQIEVFAELSPSSCSVLRTATSIATIVPEIAQIATRYYRVLASTSAHHRQKRLIFNSDTSKDGSGGTGSLLDQMVANAFKDVNFTRVALLILNNNDTMSKIQKNADSDAILPTVMREIDYEKLGRSLWYSGESEFDLEYILASIVNITQIDAIHQELITNNTVPEWLIKSIHPDLNSQAINQMFAILKNWTQNFIKIMSSPKSLDDYLFNKIQQKILSPLGNTIRRVKNQKPTTLDQLVEIILSDLNKVVMEQLTTTIKPMAGTTAGKKLSNNETSTNTETVENNISDDVKLLLYQCSIAIDSVGHTIQILLKALEQLYCTTIWE